MTVSYQDYEAMYSLSQTHRIPEEDFESAVSLSLQFLRFLTLGRIDGVQGEENVMRCICAVAEILYADGKRKGYASEHTDGYIVHYDESGELWRHAHQVAALYLFPLGLLYRGVVSC